MPGPMSAPNGDRRLCDPRVRAAHAAKGTLRTGKTELARSKHDTKK